MSIKFPIIIFLFAFFLLNACSKKDTTLPEITMKGEALVIVALNSPYTDAGATATDDVDGVLNVSADGSVDTNFAGTYYITYSATDASANLAEATRTIIVRNEAYIYNGSYNAMSVVGTDTSYFTTPFTTSNTLNQRVWLVGFSNIENAAVYADLRHDTVNIPHQIVNTVSPTQIHAFSGSGFIKTINEHTVFEINFVDSVSGNVYNGISVYTKTN
jgi:hypothetical protein